MAVPNRVEALQKVAVGWIGAGPSVNSCCAAIEAFSDVREQRNAKICCRQTPEEVVMIWRGDNQVRHVHLDEAHAENARSTWHGDSVGHYEGNALVVDTVAILEHPLSFVDNYRTPHTGERHVVERFQLVGDERIEVAIYVEDPDAFTMPWRAPTRRWQMRWPMRGWSSFASLKTPISISPICNRI
jgi:hypothetical protein